MQTIYKNIPAFKWVWNSIKSVFSPLYYLIKRIGKLPNRYWLEIKKYGRFILYKNRRTFFLKSEYTIKISISENEMQIEKLLKQFVILEKAVD